MKGYHTERGNALRQFNTQRLTKA